MYSTRSWNAYKIHLRRKHNNFGNNNDVFETAELNNLSYDDNEMELIHEVDPNEELVLNESSVNHKRSYIMLLAKYFLSLETEHKVSKLSIDSIAFATKNLMASICQSSAEKVSEILRKLGKTEEETSEIVGKLLTDLSTDTLVTADRFLTNYSRESVYRKLCRLISPEPVLLGFKNMKVKGKLKRNRVFGYIVPLKQMLEALLNLPEIWYYFTNPVFSNDGIHRDVNDGNYVQSHTLSADPQNFLKLSLYYDDVEFQNPLRSSQKYKMALFYFQILNIPVQFRSKLTCVFLYGMCNSKDLSKFGLNNFLRNFTQTVNQLATDGLEVTVNGVQRVIKGTLLYAIADNPAAALLGGFKASSSFSQKPCRRCMADQTSMREKFLDKDFTLRTMEAYKEQCETINNAELSKEARAFWSKKYGVTKMSALCSISDFPVTSNLVMDPMHLIAEGVACHLLALFLHRCIIEYRFFTLDWLNTKIMEYPFGKVEKGHLPEVITKNQIVTDVHIKQKAVAMLSLLFCLPHILGEVFQNGDDHYRHLICLVKITQIAFSPYSTSETHAELQNLIQSLGTEWSRLYPLSRTRPKLHYLCHLVEQMKMFSSLHGVSCLRHESKHFWFKDARIKNYKNLGVTLTNKHQMYLCHKMLDIHGAPARNFVYAGDEISEGNTVVISRESEEVYQVLTQKFGVQNSFTIYEVPSVTVNGTEYITGCVLVINVDSLGHPTFGEVENIFVKDEIKYFVVNKLEAACYLWQYHSYEVERTNVFKLLAWSELKNVFPLKLHKRNDKKLVMNRYSQYTGPY